MTLVVRVKSDQWLDFMIKFIKIAFGRTKNYFTKGD